MKHFKDSFSGNPNPSVPRETEACTGVLLTIMASYWLENDTGANVLNSPEIK